MFLLKMKLLDANYNILASQEVEILKVEPMPTAKREVSRFKRNNRVEWRYLQFVLENVPNGHQTLL